VGADGVLYNTHQFTFDHVYDQDASQQMVYERSAKDAVLSTLAGYNAAMLAYGQTGTGKTFTMEGDPRARHGNSAIGILPGDLPPVGDDRGAERGIIPRAIEDIFNRIKADTSTRSKYLVRASYVQIYNEVISDLLKPERVNLHIREDKKRGVFVEGLSEWVVRTPDEIYGLMDRGASQRTTGATRMNELSSRSHAVFIVIVENSKLTEEAGQAELRQSFKVGKLNLVDLAGSERVGRSGATGVRLEESKKINQSLSALGNVIKALTEPKGRPHIPYRDSKLTRILEDSLGGNCKTTMMAMISPALESFTESLSTLKFANRAKHIKNTAHINEDLDQKSLLRKYERELKRLRQELDERTKNLVDKRALLQIEEQRRKAEADKMRAITELEQRSKEFLKEKKERSELEQRINEMQSQLLGGGAPAPDRDSDEFKAVLREEQERVKAEYEGKIRELEADRQEAEEGRAQVGRYKAVLLKQRDIMIALTARLNERDETIIRMQEELKAYDSEYRRVEDALDAKTAELIALRRAAMQQNADSPHRNRDLVDALGGWAGSGTTPRAKSLGMDGKGNSSRVGGAHEVTLNGDDYADSDGSDGAGRRNIEAGRAKLMELQYDQFRAEMASRLEEKNRKIQTMEEENARLRVDTESRTKQADAEAPGRELHAQAVTHAKEQVHQLSEKVDGFTRERAALKTILESKMSTLVDGIARSFEELGDDGRRHPRLAREISALDRLVTATVHAMEF
jgi:kinesin family protein 3/17